MLYKNNFSYSDFQALCQNFGNDKLHMLDLSADFMGADEKEIRRRRWSWDDGAATVQKMEGFNSAPVARNGSSAGHGMMETLWTMTD